MAKNNIMNAVIVDDDADSRKLLSFLLKKFPEIRVVGEAENVLSALDIIHKKKPDSIFLDIKMNKGNGFDLIEKLSENTKPKVVFVSAYDDYALKAFEHRAFDYIKKPVDKERLAITIERLLKESNGTNGNGHSDSVVNIQNEILPKPKSINENDKKETLEAAFENNNDDQDSKKILEYDDRLFITVDGVSRFIKISSIQCITAEKDYSYIYLIGGKKLLVLKPMVEWEKRLTPKYFVRIHRSTIINLEYVEKVEKWFNSSYHVYILNIEDPFQMSRRYAAKLKERFK